MLLILFSKGAERLLMGPAIEKPESSINRISNVGRAGLGSEPAEEGVVGGIDASSCFPQRPEREGCRTRTDTISRRSIHGMLGSQCEQPPFKK